MEKHPCFKSLFEQQVKPYLDSVENEESNPDNSTLPKIDQMFKSKMNKEESKQIDPRSKFLLTTKNQLKENIKEFLSFKIKQCE